MARDFDVLILGAGCAGLFAALKLSKRKVMLTLPADALGGGTASLWAQGGIAAAAGARDTIAGHACDTLAAAGGIGDAAMADICAREIGGRVEDLQRFGVDFDRSADGGFILGREAAHRHRRIIRVRGDYAGRALMAALIARAKEAAHIDILPRTRAVQLAVDDAGVTGVWLERFGEAPFFVPARAVVLASGGAGHLYAATTNPPGANGEGLGLALQAGAAIADAEFVQFHATALAVGKDPAPLASEALRGEGGVLLDENGERFMTAIDARAELAPRDITARALAERLAAGGKVFLDIRALAAGEDFAGHFSVVARACKEAGLDPARTLLPVAPAAHYHMGGVAVDKNGASSLTGLWVCGEAAGSGLHGANRLAGNGLGESLVLAARTAAAIDDAFAAGAFAVSAHPDAQPPRAAMLDDKDMQDLRRMMTRYAGPLRDGEGLGVLLDFLNRLKRAYPAASRAGNIILAAHLIALAALRRRESRGAHFRRDFPAPDPAQAQRAFLTRDDLAVNPA